MAPDKSRPRTDPARSVTCCTLAQQTGTIAVTLRNRGIGAGDFVAIAVPQSVNHVVAMRGVLHSGAAYSVLDMDLPPERRASIYMPLGPALFIADRGVARSACAHPTRLAYVNHVLFGGDRRAKDIVVPNGSCARPVLGALFGW